MSEDPQDGDGQDAFPDSSELLKQDPDSSLSMFTTAVAETKKMQPPKQSVPAYSGDITTSLLQFLSSASNEMLGSIAIALIACTYLLLGRIGLLLIGALGGIMLRVTWENRNQDASTDLLNIRQKKGLDVLKRVLDWREGQPSRHSEDDTEDGLTGNGFEDFQPQTAKALTELVEAVLRDYVCWWYHPIIPGENSFPVACREALTAFLRSISLHQSRKRPAETFLNFVTNSSSIVIVFLSELSTALSASQSSILVPEEAVKDYLLANPESNLSTILNEEQQKKKFKVVAEDMLQNFLSNSIYNCQPARTFLREILSNVIMESSLKACSRPEWLNSWIVYLLEDGEADIMHVIDAGMGVLPANEMDVSLDDVALKSKQFEAKKHQRRLSKAEEAMEEAMEEAQRLSQLIAEEDMKRLRDFQASEDSEPAMHGLTVRETTSVASQPSSPSVQSNSGIQSMSPPLDSTEVAPVAPTLPPRPQFTNFDQILPTAQSILQPEQHPRRPVAPLTLFGAGIMIDDDSDQRDLNRLRNKPGGDYMIQIEPASGHQPGWMVFRRYADFETLHEVLKRIAAISGVVAFTGQHIALPNWKSHTRSSLRIELQRYLRDACGYQPLAESEGLKRFLQRDDFSSQSSLGRGNFGWPTPAAFESMGKGMLDILTSAPKGAAEGGKVVLDGVSGVLGNIGSLGQKKRENSGGIEANTHWQSSNANLVRLASTPSINESPWSTNSQDNLTESPSTSAIVRQSSDVFETQGDGLTQSTHNTTLSTISQPKTQDVGVDSISSKKRLQPGEMDLENIVLPPPPSDIPDDYGSSSGFLSLDNFRTYSAATPTRTSTSTAPSVSSPVQLLPSTVSNSSQLEPPKMPKRPQKEAIPLTEEETRVAIELLFAIVTELYTLSSAWNIRRTLLNAAKAFLLRPGNPSLLSIQSLVQESVIASNTSDDGIAAQLRKIRENTLPTEEELKKWPAELSEDEKEELRRKARKLFIERGVPPALTSVMSQAATNEAMAKVFDCLQIEEVGRGLMFGLLLQGARAVTH